MRKEVVRVDGQGSVAVAGMEADAKMPATTGAMTAITQAQQAPTTAAKRLTSVRGGAVV